MTPTRLPSSFTETAPKASWPAASTVLGRARRSEVERTMRRFNKLCDHDRFVQQYVYWDSTASMTLSTRSNCQII